VLVDFVLPVVDCALFDAFVCTQQCCTYTLLSVPSSAVHIPCCLYPAVLYIYLNYLFLLPLQEKIDTVTVGVENVGEEDCVEIKTEEDYIQFVKCEQEVSVLCWCVLW
jgi:hypothetical protein